MTNPLISRLRLLTSLTDGDLRALDRACASTVRFAADISFVAEGSRPGNLHIVLEGWAARYRLLSGGRRQIPTLLLPGDICDFDGFILQRVHSGASTLTECIAAVLPHAELETLMDERPAICEAFWWLLSVENAISAEWSVGLGRRSAEERLAHLLCEILLRLWTVGRVKDNSFAMPISQGDLADIIGLSVVHTNRMLMELRSRRLITLERRQLTVLDLEALKRLAGFRSDYLYMQGLRLRSFRR